jgi:hypothetical protein
MLSILSGGSHTAMCRWSSGKPGGTPLRRLTASVTTPTTEASATNDAITSRRPVATHATTTPVARTVGDHPTADATTATSAPCSWSRDHRDHRQPRANHHGTIAVLTRTSVLHKRLWLIVDGHGQYSIRSQRLAGKDFLHYRLNAGNGITGTGTGLTSRR